MAGRESVFGNLFNMEFNNSASRWVIGRILPTYTSSEDASRNPLVIAWVLLVHFLLSIHHGWIDPLLQTYRSIYMTEQRMAEQASSPNSAPEEE